MRKKLYDSKHDRLVYIGEPANEDFWDNQWERDERLVRRTNHFVRRHTLRYLDPPACVIDAGCGLAHSVFSLHKAGFNAWGVDFAAKTVDFVNSVAPELKVRLGDVRQLPFQDGFFDGVWSLGVIEHFFDGYDNIVCETRRVLKPGGYAFVTAPAMSPLRRLKARCGSYATFTGDSFNFYQFALPQQSVIDRFTAGGFVLVETRRRGGVMGLNDELKVPLLSHIFSAQHPIVKGLKIGLDQILTPISFHTQFYVFKAV